MKQFVIIGNSAAGIAAAQAIRQRDKSARIIIVSDEDYFGYCRCLISYYLAGEIKEDKILYRPESFYKENDIELLLNKKVSRVDPKKNRVICEGKDSFAYDALLVATGASPNFPQTEGIKKRGVFGLRTIKDAKEIFGLVPVTKTACILGGGLVGLKAAYALKRRNLDVKVIIKSQQVLSQILDLESAKIIERRLEDNGIELILGQDIVEIIGEEGEIKAVKLESGKVIGCSLIIVGKGVSANIAIVKDAGINTNEGIVVDSLMQSNIPNIYAAGDVAESFDLAIGRHSMNALWPIAVEQGKIAGANISGESLNYDGSLGMNSIEFFGLPAISLGVYKVSRDDPSFEEVKITDVKANIYKKLILRQNTLVGAVLVGDIGASGVFLRLIRHRANISSIKEKLLSSNFGYPDIIDLVNEKERIYI
jgi:NAD(P)H-nitrite reductase large subunit